MNFGSSDWRHRRTFLHQGMPFHPMQYSIFNYSTETIDKKYPLEELACPLTEGGLLDKLNSIADPLKKNLADSVVITEEKNSKNKKMSLEVDEFYYESNLKDETSENMKTKGTPSKSDFYPSFTGIAGFFTSFFGAISGAMFQKRPKSPTSQYYDCYEDYSRDDRQGAPTWPSSKFEDQNKNKTPGEQFSSSDDSMNNYRAAVVQCENKLSVVKNLLTNKTARSVPAASRLRQRRPKRVFVQPNSVEQNYEDAFASDEYISLENEEYVEYFPIPRKCDNILSEIEAPKTKVEITPENTEIVKEVSEVSDKAVVENCDSSETSQIMPESTIKILNNDCISKVILENSEKHPLKVTEINVNNSSVNPETMPESTEVVITLSDDCISKDVTENKVNLNSNVIVDSVDSKKEIISSCEDKIAKLKLLLQGKKKKPTIQEENLDLVTTVSTPEPVKVDTRPKRPSKSVPINKAQDKHFKNPHRLSTDKRKSCRMKRNIQDDILFANEIDSGDISSVENSPKALSMERLKSSEESLSETPDNSFKDKEYFDEVKGRFYSSSTTDSEDSFQIVFADSPKLSRLRRPSDCDSEDSFIVFEDSPDSCYASHEVFCEESDESDNESESELSDSGLDICKLSHSLSRTVSDLTDNSLYEETVNGNNSCDELDCAVRTVCEEISPREIEESKSEEVKMVEETVEEERRGLLLDEVRKLKKKNEPKKKVTFSTAPPTVRVMRVWAFAARQARAGHWERYSRDAERFKRRIADVDMAISWVLKPQHRKRVMFQRFMPWWHQQKRKEAEEKKRREQEEKERKEREEKERLEREEQERIQREKEEEEEMKRLVLEMREEQKRADRERMERRLQEKLLEKEQDRLLMEEEERQRRFLELKDQDQQKIEAEKKYLTEANEDKQNVTEVKSEDAAIVNEQDQKSAVAQKQVLLVADKSKAQTVGKLEETKKTEELVEKSIANKETNIQEQTKSQAQTVKIKTQTEKQEALQKKNTIQQTERKRLDKDKIEKFQQQQQDQDRRLSQQEKIEIDKGSKSTEKQLEMMTETQQEKPHDQTDKHKIQSQIEKDQEVTTKPELKNNVESKLQITEAILKPHHIVDNTLMNKEKSSVQKEIVTEKTIQVNEVQKDSKNNVKGSQNRAEDSKDKLTPSIQANEKNQDSKNNVALKTGTTQKKDNVELPKNNKEEQQNVELPKNNKKEQQKTEPDKKQKKTEDHQEEKEKEDLNIQDKSKVGANQLGSKKCKVVNSNTVNSKTVNYVGPVIHDDKVKQNSSKHSTLSYSKNVTISNFEKATVEGKSTNKIIDTGKSQIDEVTVNNTENAPVGKDTTDIREVIDPNIFINNIDDKNKVLKPPDTKVNTENVTQTHFNNSIGNNTQRLGSKVMVSNNIDNKLHIGDDKNIISPSASKVNVVSNLDKTSESEVTVNNIDKNNTKANNKPVSKPRVNNIDKKLTDSKLTSNKVDKTFNKIDNEFSLVDTKSITNNINVEKSIDSKSTVNNLDTEKATALKPTIDSADLNKTQINIETKDTKNESTDSKNQVFKPRNKKTSSLYESPKERRNRRINKKLIFLQNQLAELQQDLNSVTESISGT